MPFSTVFATISAFWDLHSVSIMIWTLHKGHFLFYFVLWQGGGARGGRGGGGEELFVPSLIQARPPRIIN